MGMGLHKILDTTYQGVDTLYFRLIHYLENVEPVNAAALCPAVDVVNCPYIDGIGVHM